MCTIQYTAIGNSFSNKPPVGVQDRCARQVCETGVQGRCARQVCKTNVQDRCARQVCKTCVQDRCARRVCKTGVQDRCARQVCKTRGRENKNPMKTSAKTGLCGVFCSPCQWLTMHRAPTRSSRLLPAATQPTLQTMSKCRMPYILRHNHGANRNPKCHSSIRHETQAEKRGMRSTIHGPCKWGVRGMVHGSCKKGER